MYSTATTNRHLKNSLKSVTSSITEAQFFRISRKRKTSPTALPFKSSVQTEKKKKKMLTGEMCPRSELVCGGSEDNIGHNM